MRSICAVLMAVGALFLAGCGSSAGDAENAQAQREEFRPPRNVTVTLDAHPGPENVGILMAEEKGFFAKAGLDVAIAPPVWPRRPVTYVAQRNDDIGLGQLPQVMIAREKGARIRAVGSVISRPTAAMIWLRGSGLRSIADLEGKTIAVPGVPFQEALLGGVLKRAGLSLEDVKVKGVGYGLVPALLEGKADAIFGGSWNLEGVQLRSLGAKPVVKRVESLGVPAYDELVVIARTRSIAHDPRLIRTFMAAVARGTAAATRDPAAAVGAIEKSLEPDGDLSRTQIEAEVEATLPLLSNPAAIDLARARRFAAWMNEEGLTRKEVSASGLAINRFLPSP
jgi:ABC-type nitrate/sulfonate/bicarbonate transport system substrate-binding protein